ncbi:MULTISPECIES: hypothetical protein [Thalassospira]|uniref:Uncharacterized protein n=1 Tax=Thalassospira xiamenensis TaxID=220697 RepID=A0ABR5XXL1_9PROT|nr:MULTISPECIES: hypothetical protein [Thalassospira]KZC97212.1 hypothetical protein AUP40_04545 [Thalassospira xiamenensis]KZD10195.1 hypothetical protein AUP45_02665 [Thalassospira xiamenensis]MCD1593157.1 hypothetical protein [Thalassospira xiamenensis]MDM7975192.1 hypothetical protein [Thalassospira xiamenensis]OHZ01021.1 hypothetical protein BC440_09295 [Thalassospira sp. MIT1004]
MRYFMIKSGPMLDRANDYRARHEYGFDAATEFAKKYGGTRFWSGLDGRLIGITAVRKPGPEWIRDRKQGYWHPSRDSRKKAAMDIWDEIRILPPIPGYDRRNSEPALWLGIDTACRCQLGYKDDLFYLFLTDKNMLGTSVKDQLKIIADLPVPEGCEEISEAKLNLLLAEREQAA